MEKKLSPARQVVNQPQTISEKMKEALKRVSLNIKKFDMYANIMRTNESVGRNYYI